MAKCTTIVLCIVCVAVSGCNRQKDSAGAAAITSEAGPAARWDIKTSKDDDGNVVAISVFKNGGVSAH